MNVSDDTGASCMCDTCKGRSQVPRLHLLAWILQNFQTCTLVSAQVTDFLAMVGNPRDAVPGVKGIGRKTAMKLMLEYGSLDNILVAASQVPFQMMYIIERSAMWVSCLTRA
jgi:5'-3' exonuclease